MGGWWEICSVTYTTLTRFASFGPSSPDSSASARLRLDICASRFVSTDVAAVDGLLEPKLVALWVLLLLLTLFELDDSEGTTNGAEGVMV